MDQELLAKLQAFIAESGKVLHMDASHSAIRSNIQAHLAATHRATNPDSGYYDYPMVADVYGDQESGQVIYSKGASHSRADYKVKDGITTLSNHKSVRKAYVAEADLTQESEVTETIAIQEAAALDKDGRGEICIIKPMTGSMAHYTAEALELTAQKGTIKKGTQMFMDHQTAEERAARPEGTLEKLVATLEGDATWKKGKEGFALYAPIKAYADFVPFINERAKDIGVSVRGTIRPTGKIVNGLPEAEEIASIRSIDFVTRAGAGGKLLPVYESYKAGQQPPPEVKKKEKDGMEINESEYNALKAQAALVPALQIKLDRVDESLRRMDVSNLVSITIAECSLPDRAKARIAKPFLLPNYAAPLKDGVLDVTALTAAVKEAIKDETAYLQESGILNLSPVNANGAGADGKAKTEDELSQEADRVLNAATRELQDLPAEEVKK